MSRIRREFRELEITVFRLSRRLISQASFKL